jgi:hypothetical protein
MKHKVSKYEHETWTYYVCGEHGRHYSNLKEVEMDHPEGYEMVVKKLPSVLPCGKNLHL